MSCRWLRKARGPSTGDCRWRNSARAQERVSAGGLVWKVQDRRHAHGYQSNHVLAGRTANTTTEVHATPLRQSNTILKTEPSARRRTKASARDADRIPNSLTRVRTPAPRRRDRCSLPPPPPSSLGKRCTACGATASKGPSSPLSPLRP